MSDPNAALPVAGWYPDPEHETQDRWWDGTAWSDHRRPREAAAVAPAAAAAPAATAGYAYVPADTQNPYGTSTVPYAGAPLQPYGTAPAYPYGYPQPPQNVPALVGFILALVGFAIGIFIYGLLGLAGGIVSIVGLVKANKMKKAGLPGHRYGMAMAGVIVGFGSLVLTILAFVLYFVVLFGALGAAYDYSTY